MNNENQNDLKQNYEDFKLGRFFIYAGIANFFCGVYTAITLILLSYFSKRFSYKKEYLKITLIIFIIYFLFIYSVLFYWIFNERREIGFRNFGDIMYSNIFYSLPVTLYNLYFILKRFKLN